MLRRALPPLAALVLVVALLVWRSRKPNAPVGASLSDVAASDAAQAAERLRAFDASRRLSTDFARVPTWDELRGADPYVIARIPGKARFVGALRGDDAVVLLDTSMNELAGARAPASPSALDVAEDGSIWVAGEHATQIARFVARDDELLATGTWDLAPLRAIRGIAKGPGNFIYVAEENEGTVWAFELANAGVSGGVALGGVADPLHAPREGVGTILSRREIGRCRGPVRLRRVGDWLIANCVLDHRVVMFKIGASGAPIEAPQVAVTHDGPLWSLDAAMVGDDLWLALGGVEDHPLDRTIGAFGYIDSFLFLYRVLPDGGVFRERAVNVSEFGVVTPKAIALRMGRDISVLVTGYGSSTMAEITFAREREPVVRTRAFVPGATSVASLDDGAFAFANPLLDAWVVMNHPDPSRNGSPTLVVVKSPTRSRAPAETPARAPSPEPLELHLGEALFFTTLMAPFNRSDGALSRFTCETCHFEGYVDGRTHHTGRDDVHAVTKPLLGLFNNRPHFSRALDPDLTAVVFNEFRVAGAKSDRDPWFALSAKDAPWLRWLDPNGAEKADSWAALLGPEALRKALMTFLIAFQHRPNPAVLGRTQWSEEERRGAALFRDHCESCHEARLSTDLATSRVPFERWEPLVMSREGSIVWANDSYVRSGVVPYVHEKGARVPSLRRLYKKHPYFTNGSAASLEEVLLRARYAPSGFRHDPGSEGFEGDAPSGTPSMGEAIAEEDRRALLAFLRLL